MYQAGIFLAVTRGRALGGVRRNKVDHLIRALMNASGKSEILVVCHGSGLGRLVATGKVFLDRLRQTDPDLARRIRIHKTGGAEPDLAGCALIIFWLGDPLMQLYPACFSEAAAIARQARSRQIPILNTPWALSNTLKSRQSDIWQASGIPAARAVRVENEAGLKAALRSFGAACLLRSDEAHAQRDVLTLDQGTRLSRRSLERYLPGVLLEVIDVRAAYRQSAGVRPPAFSRYHHKARAFVFRDEVKPCHLMFSEALVVGVSNSVFNAQDRRLERTVRRLGFKNQAALELVQQDLAYFADPAASKDMLSKAVSALGLDFAAVDYAILPDGELIIWEANPFFYLPPGTASVMSSERQAVRRVNESLDWMAGCLRSIVSSETLQPGVHFSEETVSQAGML